MSSPTETLTQTERSKYDEYEDAGVDWLGEIPAHWERIRLKFLADFTGGGTPAKDNREYWKGNIPWVSPKDMKAGWVTDTQDHITPEAVAESSTRLVDPGSVLIVVRSGILRHTIPVATNEVEVALNQDLKAITPDDSLHSRFLTYLIEGRNDTLLLKWTKSGTTVESLEQERISNTEIPVPSPDEQRAIAAYLDRETERIDALIEKKERLIDLLEEKRTALISRVVTKGLDKDVEMQDSGVEWLGEIPSHWEDARLKFVAQLETGHTPSRSKDEYWENLTIPWVTLSDVGKLRDGTLDYIYETEEKISKLGLENSSARLLPEGTVILSRTASVGFATILGKPMATTQDFVNWICKDKLEPKYLLHCFRSMRQEFDRITDGSTHETIYMPEVERFKIPLPPVEEQREIASRLDRKTDQIDALVSKVNQAIECLQEYRTALISAAVTGQIDVRKEVNA